MKELRIIEKRNKSLPNIIKKIILSLIIISSISTTVACNNKEINIEDKTINQNINKESDNVSNIKININGENLIINLEENETTKEFVKLLPQQYTMNELNGNEKYVYLDHPLPENPYNPNQINKGDVMLFGDNCLVIFYKTFNTNYSYTKIGHIDNLPDLNTGSITVKIEK